jgi:hypothetical protein
MKCDYNNNKKNMQTICSNYTNNLLKTAYVQQLKTDLVSLKNADQYLILKEMNELGTWLKADLAEHAAAPAPNARCLSIWV